MEITCPICGNGHIIEKEKVFICSEQKYNKDLAQNEGCGFQVWKTMFGTILTLDDISKLTIFESIEKDCVSKSNKSYTGILTLNPDTWAIDLSFKDNNNSTDENGISEFAKGFKKGDIVIWKSVVGETITKEDAIKLFNGEMIRKEKFLSRAGKEFKGNLILNTQEAKVEIIFDEN